MRRSLLAGGALIGFATAGHGQIERLTLAGTHVGVYNLAGTLRIEGGSGAETTVEVRRNGTDGARLHVERATIRGEEAVRVVFPGTTIVYGGGRERTAFATTTLDEDGTYHKSDVVSGKRVTIRNTGVGTRAFADVRVTVARGTHLTVGLAVGDVIVDNVDGQITVEVLEGSIDVAGAKDGVTASVGSGTITVADSRGALTLDAGSGSIRIRDAWPDRIEAATESGEVRIANIKVPALRVKTGSGSIRMTSTELKTFAFETASGRIEAELETDVDSASVSAASGSVILRIARKVGAALNIATTSGGILTDLAVANASRTPSLLRGTIGDGRGELRVETTSGTVQLIKR